MKITDRSIKAELRVGSRTCQCGVCSAFFGGVDTFDKHLIGIEQTRCRTPKEMRAIGLEQNEHGVWLNRRYLNRGKAQD